MEVIRFTFGSREILLRLQVETLIRGRQAVSGEVARRVEVAVCGGRHLPPLPFDLVERLAGTWRLADRLAGKKNSGVCQISAAARVALGVDATLAGQTLSRTASRLVVESLEVAGPFPAGVEAVIAGLRQALAENYRYEGMAPAVAEPLLRLRAELAAAEGRQAPRPRGRAPVEKRRLTPPRVAGRVATAPG